MLRRGVARLPTSRSSLGDLEMLRSLSFYAPVCEMVVRGPAMRVVVAGAWLVQAKHPHALQIALCTTDKSVLFKT